RVESELCRIKPRHSHPSRQHEVELISLLANATTKIGPEGPPGEFYVWAEATKGNECVLDPRREPDAMRQERFSKLEVDHFRAERNLSSVPAVADRIGDSHHPRGHQCRPVLFGLVEMGQSMGKQVSSCQSNFLSADRDRGGDISSLGEGRRHHRSEYQSRESSNEQSHTLSRSISCRLV